MNNFINTGILKYSEINSQKEPILLKELNRETHLKILNPRMLSGAFQGRLISLISKLIKPKKVLEIGTYTGYSALCIYEGLDKKGIIHTIDKNEELVEIQNYLTIILKKMKFLIKKFLNSFMKSFLKNQEAWLCQLLLIMNTKMERLKELLILLKYGEKMIKR